MFGTDQAVISSDPRKLFGILGHLSCQILVQVCIASRRNLEILLEADFQIFSKVNHDFGLRF